VLQLKTALQKDANHKDARFNLGVALRETGDLAGAEKELRRALELGYDKGQADLELARTVYSQGKLDEFVKEFGGQDIGSPEANADLRAMTGNALFARGKINDAVQAYEEALRLSATNSMARVGQARVAAARGDMAAATTILTEILGKSPTDREALTLRAAIHQTSGERDQSIAVMRKLVEYYPESIGDRYALASQLLEAGKIDDAKAAVTEMAKKAPNDPRTLHVLAMLAYHVKDYAGALEKAVQALSRAPGFTPAQVIAGAAAVQLKSYQQAIQYLTSAVKAQKRNLFVHQLLVAAYLGAGETERAQRTLNESLELFPKDARLLLLAGEVAARNRNLGDAAKYFELSAEQGDASGLASLRHGQALLAEGKEEEGLRVLEESARSSTDKAQSDVALVAHHLRRGEIDKALKWVDAAEKKSPGAALAPTLRGVVLLTKRDSANARKQFEIALQRDPAAASAIRYLASMDLVEKKPQDARKRYETAVAANPKSEQLTFDYARLLRASGEKVEVISAPLVSFLKDNPGAERIRLMLIETTFSGGDRKQAVSLAREAVAAVPDSINLKMALASTLQSTGDHNQALATYGEVQKTQPRSVPVLVGMARSQVALGERDKAIETLDRALQIAPDSTELKRIKVQALVVDKKYESALRLAREVREKQPKQALGYELESGVLALMEKWPETVEVLQTGQRQAPSAAMVIRLHAALTKTGMKDRAAQVASEWIAANSKDITVRAYLSERATRDDDHQTAVRYYKEAVAIAPNNSLLLNNLAWSADKIKDPKALEYAEAAFKLSPQSTAIMDTLGWLLVQRGDTARGLDLLEKAAKASPNLLAIRFNYAQALIKVGRKDDARKELDFLKSQGDR
ncbi:MAG: XrtA/PEP-CTERM system TPR-repeat protein PrsT, partial [Burkholderiales bacterium]